MDSFVEGVLVAARGAVYIGVGIALVVWVACLMWILVRRFSGLDEKDARDYERWENR